MDDTLIWCALIGAVAYAIKPMLPTYYELTKVSQHRLDAINDAVDDMEQTVLAIGSANEKMQRRLEVLESDAGGSLTRLDDLNETVEHNCLRLAVLEGAALDAKTGTPANEARHD